MREKPPFARSGIVGRAVLLMSVGAQDAGEALAASLEGWAAERGLDIRLRRSANDVRALVLSVDLDEFRAAWPSFEQIGTTWVNQGR